MFERFTDRARRVVVLAQEASRDLHHDYIGTEHLLLGLLHEFEGPAARALRSLGLDLEGARAEVVERIGMGDTKPQGHIPFTPRAKKVLEISLREALKLGHSWIGTEHLLLSLAREGEGVAAQILMAKVHGGLAEVSEAVLAELRSRGDEIPESEGAGPRVEPRIGAGETKELLARLEAIEARLSAIERLLRDRGEEAS